MSTDEVRVEVDPREVRIVRGEREAQRVGSSQVTIVPIGDVVRAVAIPGQHGVRYLRIEATKAAVQPDPERDPLVVRFTGRRATEADRLAAVIQQNALTASSPQGAPIPVIHDEAMRRKLNFAATASMWSAGIGLVILLVPVVIVIAVFVAIVVALS